MNSPFISGGALLSSSSSTSYQDRWLSPFPARSWPEAFHATFIHNIHKHGEDRIGRRRSLVPLSVLPTYHNYYPTTLTEQEVGEGKKGGRTSETHSHSHSYSFTSRPVIRGITAACRSSPHALWCVRFELFGSSWCLRFELVGGGSGPVCESVSKADLLSTHFESKHSRESVGLPLTAIHLLV